MPADIRAIAQDRAGKFWLATTPDVPNFFDPNTEHFSHRWPETNRARLNEPASAIFAGPDGVLWRATSSGLEIFHPESGAFAVLRHNAADRYSLSGNEILSLAADRDGGIWVGTKEGVNRFVPSNLRFGAWRRNSADPRSLSDENVRAIYRDRSGVLWIGTYNGGLNRYDAASGTFTHFRHDARDSGSLDNDRVYSVYEDKSRNSLGRHRPSESTGWTGRTARSHTLSAVRSTPVNCLYRPIGFSRTTGKCSGSVLEPPRRLSDRQTGVVTAVSDSVRLSMHRGSQR